MTAFLVTPVFGEVRPLIQAIPAHEPVQNPLGDCYRTCIAALVASERPEDVPHFVQQGTDAGNRPWEHFRLARWWLRSEKGLDLAYITEAEAVRLKVPYILTVKSKGGAWPHALIAQGREVLHDPSGKNYSIFERWDQSPVEIICEPYEPSPDELVRMWEALS